MKQFFTLLAAVFISASTFAQVGINTEIPDASSALDITSNTGGLLTPRMTAAQRDAIATPSQGLIIFCTDCASGEGELQISLSSVWKNLPVGDVNDPPPPMIGDFYGGGVVFYIFEAADAGYVAGQTHGLIAALSYQSTAAEFGCIGTATGATATAIGTGAQNTIDIELGCTTSGTAADLCANYSVTDGGVTYNDWFLPSQDELNQMYLKRGIINTTATANGGGNFNDSQHWSSTEEGGPRAYRQNFSNAGQNVTNKDSPDSVRAIRAF